MSAFSGSIPPASKQKWRISLRQQRDLIFRSHCHLGSFTQLAAAFCTHSLAALDILLPDWRGRAPVFAIYLSYGAEAPTTALLSALSQHGCRLLVPLFSTGESLSDTGSWGWWSPHLVDWHETARTPESHRALDLGESIPSAPGTAPTPSTPVTPNNTPTLNNTPTPSNLTPPTSQPSRYFSPSNLYPATVTDLSECEAVFLPALGVDVQGTRLGQGGGWYDRSLGLFPERPLSLALTYQDLFLPSATLPREAHDRTVDVVVTESGWQQMPPPPA